MLKIMLADDEGIVIDSLKYIINRNFGDNCIVEFAKSGRTVIELAERFRPDIAIMDIHMPGINGIEAMREIKKMYSQVVFIVMSAFDKFDYAKEAINLGVIEYLHKPVEQKKIVDVLKRAMDVIEVEKKKRSNDLLIREKLETVVPIIENGLIYNILFQENFKEDVDNYKTLLGISKDYGYMLVLVCGEEQEGSHMTNAVGMSIRLQGKYREVREVIREYFDGIVGAVMANKIAVFVPYQERRIDYNQRIDLIERAREMSRKLKHQVKLCFRIGIGSVRTIHDSMQSYNEALKSLVQTTGRVAHVDDLPLSCDYEENYPIDVELALFNAISDGNLNETITMAARFFDWMTVSYPNCIMDIRLKVLELTLRAEHIAYENGGMTYQFRSRHDYLSKVMQCEDSEILKQWLIEKVSLACRNISTIKQGQSRSVVEVAKSYIEENYSRDLSLDDVSRKVDISPYYFSRIFKEQVGKNFIDYLTDLRIEKAKKLLKQSEMSMKEICASIGYSDPNYFSRTFKKNVGVTPTVYKEGRFT